jgi:hypothetical protein
MEAKNKKIVIGVVVVLAIVVGVYLYKKKKNKPKTNTESKGTEIKSDADVNQTTKSVDEKIVESPKPAKQDNSENILNEVMKNSLGKGKLKTNDKKVNYVEVVINDPLKKPYTWNFYPTQKFEVFNDKKLLTFRGSFRNGGLRQIIGTDNYEFGTANLTGITITGKNLDEIALRMFTLKP